MTSRRTVLVRVILAVLILLNMAAIFRFSGESAEESTSTSTTFTEEIAEKSNYQNYNQKTDSEKQTIVNQLHLPVRKLAHMAEFGSLGALVFLFLLTFSLPLPAQFLTAIAFTSVYAVSDEFHQSFSSGRGPAVRDILLFDTGGALIVCSVLLGIVLLHRWSRRRPPIKTVYRIPCPCVPSERPVRIAVAADLHGCSAEPILTCLKEINPDLILIPGDLIDRDSILEGDQKPYSFLEQCAALAPTFYSLGNHELGCFHHGNPFRNPTKKPLPDFYAEKVRQTGVHLLRNDCAECSGMTICGLDSGLDGKISRPDPDALARFDGMDGVRILLCHHPEYYVPYIRKTGIELTVCGHAHGGQWRVFGRGIYAPGQGLFPKYTSGTLDHGRCVISRGLGDHTFIPRIFNRRELVIIEFGGTSESQTPG